MVVCLCKGVSDKKINALLESGATCLRDVMASCKAGSDCGSCICQLKEMVQQSRQRHGGSAAGTAGEMGPSKK
jgi:bacterioferritin-associated ferredoxin